MPKGNLFLCQWMVRNILQCNIFTFAVRSIKQCILLWNPSKMQVRCKINLDSFMLVRFLYNNLLIYCNSVFCYIYYQDRKIFINNITSLTSQPVMTSNWTKISETWWCLKLQQLKSWIVIYYVTLGSIISHDLVVWDWKA